MSGEDTAINLIYLAVLAIFVGSALAARRIPLGQGLKMLLAWVMIFLVAFIAFTLKDDIVQLARRVIDETRAESTGVQVGEALHIKQASDGHYWVDGELNGVSTRFLIDSGATTTSISGESARRAGIEPSAGFPVIVQTANGTVAVQRGRAERLKVGAIVREDLAVHISDGFGEVNVLGMNFLSSLSGWGVEKNRLILKP